MSEAEAPQFEEDLLKDRLESEQLLLYLGDFDGPIDMLLSLARDQKVDLTKISILALANQYIEFIEKARGLRLELAADYLVMAAWLAYLKSRLLIPKEELKQSEPTAQDLAEALQLAGHDGEAKKLFAEFETKALAASSKRLNSNRELVFYYADHAHQPAKALQVAKQEYAWRHDVYTLDAYAWALHVNGQDAEARKQIEAALAVGIRDSTIFAHAGEIALKLGDRATARNYLQEAVSLHAIGSEHAQLVLAQVSGPNAQR